LKWHRNDTVSDWERNRNDIIYKDYQKNRNPFIDYPELAEYLWGGSIGKWKAPLIISSVVELKNQPISVYPNPAGGKLTIDAENFEGVEVYDTSGRLIIKSSSNTIDLEEQSKGLYLLKVNANGTTQEFKVFKD
jgi:hypothetical protein